MLRRVAYWLSPPILIFLILRRMDFGQLHNSLVGCDFWLVLLGICYYPAVVLVAALRWRLTLSGYFAIRPPLAYLARHYWIGMSIGYFSPGQVGLDAYRVVVVGRRCGQGIQTVLSILIEKLMALLNAVVLVICLYPAVAPMVLQSSQTLDRLLKLSYILLLILLCVVGLVPFAGRHPLAQRLVGLLSGALGRFLDRLSAVTGTKVGNTEVPNASAIMALLLRPRPFAAVFGASLGIQLVAAMGNQIIFRAVGYELPFLINLFICPLLYFVFLLPISFGSIGIREGAYVLLYGAFGVPAEVALLVSLINLAGILLNNAIGALLIWGKQRGHELPRADAVNHQRR